MLLCLAKGVLVPVLVHTLGRLCTLQGIITHVTDVKPLATVMVYIDYATGNEIYQEVTGRTFTPLEAQPAFANLKARVANDTSLTLCDFSFFF